MKQGFFCLQLEGFDVSKIAYAGSYENQKDKSQYIIKKKLLKSGYSKNKRRYKKCLTS